MYQVRFSISYQWVALFATDVPFVSVSLLGGWLMAHLVAQISPLARTNLINARRMICNSLRRTPWQLFGAAAATPVTTQPPCKAKSLVSNSSLLPGRLIGRSVLGGCLGFGTESRLAMDRNRTWIGRGSGTEGRGQSLRSLPGWANFYSRSPADFPFSGKFITLRCWQDYDQRSCQ